MEKEVRRELEARVIATGAVQFQWFYDAACRGQPHELIMLQKRGRFGDVDDLRPEFDDEHERIHTFKMTTDKVNFYHWCVNPLVGSGMPMPKGEIGVSEDPEGAPGSRRAAWFGVVLDASTLEIGEEATRELCRSMCEEADNSLWPPTEPGAGLFWKSRFREGDELVVEETPASLKFGLSLKAH